MEGRGNVCCREQCRGERDRNGVGVLHTVGRRFLATRSGWPTMGPLGINTGVGKTPAWDGQTEG